MCAQPSTAAQQHAEPSRAEHRRPEGLNALVCRRASPSKAPSPPTLLQEGASRRMGGRSPPGAAVLVLLLLLECVALCFAVEEKKGKGGKN